MKKCIICQKYYDNIDSKKCPKCGYKLSDIIKPVNILIKDLETNNIEHSIFCDDRRQAEILMKSIGYDKDKIYLEIEELK